MPKSFLLISLILTCITSFAGIEDDSLHFNKDTSYKHITKRAAILSAIIPGAGQIYNEIGYRKIPQKKHRAWWKVPIIYGGLAACGYYYYKNNMFANLLKQEYLFRIDNPQQVLDQRFADYPTDLTGETKPMSLIDGYAIDANTNALGFDTYAKRRDLFIIGFIGVWALNTLEAYVDAHFVTFDVSEDLSLSWHPTLIGYQYPAVSFKLNIN